MGQTERLYKIKSRLDVRMRFDSLSCAARAIWAKSGEPSGHGLLAHMLDALGVAGDCLRWNRHKRWTGQQMPSACHRKPQGAGLPRCSGCTTWARRSQGSRLALDAMRSAHVLDKPAIDIGEHELDAVLGAGYGIFAGAKVQWAELRFTPERARWVAAETWHPKQQGHFEADGSWRLRLPYADPRELVMDILRHVPEVAVIGPAGLREAVAEKLRVALGRVTP